MGELFLFALIFPYQSQHFYEFYRRALCELNLLTGDGKPGTHVWRGDVHAREVVFPFLQSCLDAARAQFGWRRWRRI